MKKIEHITLQFEHKIFKVQRKEAERLLAMIEQCNDFYDGFDWEVIERKKF